MAAILDRILRGTPVGDIPFELPSKYTLAVNRGTASALGLVIPPELLMRASVVYE
jgi:putative ABC transport system substrate-binding protein